MPSIQTTQEALIKALFEKVWNQKQVDKIQDLFAEDVVVYAGDTTVKGVEAVKELFAHWQAGFPDITHKLDQILYSDKYVTTSWHGWGTHLGIFMGMFPTKKKMHYSGITIFKVTEGKFSEVRVNADMHSILTSLKTFSDKVYTEKDFCENFQGPAEKIYEWLLKARPEPSCRQTGINALRERFSTAPLDGKPALEFSPEIMEKVTVEEHEISTRDGKIRSLVCLPEGYQITSYPILVYMHGGGWSIGTPESAALVGRKFAHNAKVIVAIIDYRLAPEYPYPCGLHDCIDAYLWARKAGKNLFNANTERVAVGGDSAGGNLAPAIVIHTRDNGIRIPDACLMLCPLTDFAFENYPSCHTFGYKGLLYDFAFLSFVRSLYSKYDQWKTPEVSPMYDHLEGFCPTFVLTAGQDLLRDENVAFVKKLKEAGGVAVHYIHEQMPHAYYYFLGLTKEEDEAYHVMSGFLRKFLRYS